MADQWYFGWGGRRFGPFSEVQLMELAEQGRVQPADTVWKEGIEKGVVAERIKNLFAPAPVTPSLEPLLAPSTTDAFTSRTHTVEHAALVSRTADKYDEWLRERNDQPANEHRREIVPDELMLKGIPGCDDVLPAPVSTTPGSSQKNIDPDLKASRGTNNASDQKQKNPVVPDQASTHQKAPKKGRAVALKGAVIVSQDGNMVHYRKKCIRCAHEDASRTSKPIRVGIHRERFFCPKCRKMGEVEIQGII